MKQPGLTPAIIAFGDLPLENGKLLEAEQILSRLISQSAWLLTRRSRAIEAGTPVLFYRNVRGVGSARKPGGVLARARVKGLEPATPQEVASLLGVDMPMFTIKVNLEQCENIDPPIAIGPLVHKLQFISNKEYWGHSPRMTPRLISQRDYALIMKGAERGADR